MAGKEYKRGKSGYSVKDEEDAAKYKRTARELSIHAKGQPGSVIRDQQDVEASVGNAEYQWKRNTKSEKGREYNRRNQEFLGKELDDVNKHKWKGSM